VQKEENRTFFEIARLSGIDAGVMSLVLRGASLDVEKKTLTVQVEASGEVDEASARAVREAIEEVVQGVKVQIDWTKKDKVAFHAKTVLAMKDQLIDYADSKTRCRHILETSDWRADEAGNLVIVPRLPDAHVILQKKKCDEILTSWITHRFDGATQVLIAEAVTDSEPDFDQIARDVVMRAAKEAEKRKKKKKEGP